MSLRPDILLLGSGPFAARILFDVAASAGLCARLQAQPA